MALDAKSRAGVTIVETLIAVSLLALVVAGAAKLITSTDGLADIARDKATAAQILKNRYERMTMTDYSDIKLWAQEEQVVGENGLPDPEGRFSISTEITQATTNLVKVIISVDTRSRRTLRFSGNPLQISTFLTEM